MNRFLEIILGLEKGFLGREGEFSLQFNPRWPFQETLGAVTWNLALGILAALLVIYVYRREGRSRPARISLGVMRALLLAFVIALLNRPVLNLGQSRTEPSVVAIMIDDSISTRVRDAGVGPDGQPLSRFEAMLSLLTGEDARLVRELARTHEVRFYRFSRDAAPVGSWGQDNKARDESGKEAGAAPPAAAAAAAAGVSSPATGPSTRPAEGRTAAEALAGVLSSLRPDGQATQVLASVRTVLESLQGQRLAGVVVLSDGRSTPSENQAEALRPIKDMGVKVYPVAVGPDTQPRNLVMEAVSVQDAAFVKDIVSVKATVRGSGYPAGHRATVALKKVDPGTRTTTPLLRADGRPAEATVTLAGDGAPQEVEVTFKPSEVGNLDLVAEVVRQSGEVDEEDNVLPAQVAVLDARISVLYVDGYPRWEFRYIKNQMIRDATVDIACLLLSADVGFAQEGDPARPTDRWPGPVTRFPESMSEMMVYDVVLFGDVDPNQFTDGQLQLVQDFVAKKGGGFGMIAGPRHAPVGDGRGRSTAGFRNTPIEALLPVSLARAVPAEPEPVTVGWRPVLTREGEASTIFRFFEDRERNARFIKEEMQPLFWYQKGVTAKPGVGEVYAEHPYDTGPDNRKAPILVLGRFGAGRTLYSGIDDSWRWRFYTGEHIFDNYWIQQLRYLARSKKLGQRRFTLTTLRPSYELGEQVQVLLRVLDPELLGQLPETLPVSVVRTDTAAAGAAGGASAPSPSTRPTTGPAGNLPATRESNPGGSSSSSSSSSGPVVRQETMTRQEGQSDLYVASWTADAVGQFALKLPALPGTEGAEQRILVKVPRLEMSQPMVDRTLLSRLASETAGEMVPLEAARERLPAAIKSAAKIVPVDTPQRLWDAPLAMIIFVLLITTEWVLRKVYGML